MKEPKNYMQRKEAAIVEPLNIDQFVIIDHQSLQCSAVIMFEEKTS